MRQTIAAGSFDYSVRRLVRRREWVPVESWSCRREA
jgi:hypothetical protein